MCVCVFVKCVFMVSKLLGENVASALCVVELLGNVTFDHYFTSRTSFPFFPRALLSYNLQVSGHHIK
ncbi:hypothetical protein Sjap_012703 [Stephania japonica]|uniref:Secreted protein n=1 Tax=Stephania japonica TaxID=461633 RepID=A0AAP0P0L7_9MAGN